MFLLVIIIEIFGYLVIGLLGYWVIGLLGYWVIGLLENNKFGKEPIYCLLK